jgi:hypothetical protein
LYGGEDTYDGCREGALVYRKSLEKRITLPDIANTAGVSHFHMTRAFAAATGRPIMRYVRGRRLSEAAKALSISCPSLSMQAMVRTKLLPAPSARETHLPSKKISGIVTAIIQTDAD